MKIKQGLKKQIIIFSIILIILLIIGGIIINTFSQKESNILVFYHWWTSPGEQSAINALINSFADNYPNITILPTSIISKNSGGGGTAMFEIVKPMVFTREAPDAFQMHAGYGAKLYFDANLLYSVDSIWESEGLTNIIPKVVQAMCQFEGHYYSVPINIHRTNIVWYNKALLDKNNINPNNLNTWDNFFDACDKLRESGIQYPIQMGTTWTAQHTFDQIIASIGIDFYEDWINGNVSSSEDPRLLETFKIFKKYLSYVNPDNINISWDQATAKIISAESAFNVMGDWANGEFKAAEQKYNEDYGTFTVPGTKDKFGIVIDAFQRPKYIKHVINSEKWLKFVASKEGQDIFNPLKGSISTRIDTDLSKYDSYQQSAISDFLTIKYIFPAVSNGLPQAFEQKEQEVIAEFIKNLDINKATKEITDYTKKTPLDYTIIWELN
jgi:glucose/mannose transport system substrate-binding protein